MSSPEAEIGRTPRQTVVVALVSMLVACGVLYLLFRIIDPLPPHRLVIATGAAGSGYDTFAQQYARVLARQGVQLEVRTSAGAIDNLELIRNPTSGVQAALTTFGVTESADVTALYSLGGVLDAAVFIFYRNAEPISLFSGFRGKRLYIGGKGTALRALMLSVLEATGALDASTQVIDDLNYAQAIDALVRGELDVAMVSEHDGSPLRLLRVPGIRLMNVSQAEAIAKQIPGLRRVVLSRGLVDLKQDIPESNVELLASRNRLLVRKDLHPALQYLLLEAMREVHSAPGPFNNMREFPAEQPHDLPLSPTAAAFYHTGSTFWQRYTAFWLTSLLNRILFFVIPVILVLLPILGFAPRILKWPYVRRINRLHRALARLERQIPHASDEAQLADLRARFKTIDESVSSLKVVRTFEVDLQRLKAHYRIVDDNLRRAEG